MNQALIKDQNVLFLQDIWYLVTVMQHGAIQ